MGIYQGVNGVNRKIKKMFQGVGGVNREVKERWEGVEATNRQVFKSFNPLQVNFATTGNENFDNIVGVSQIVDSKITASSVATNSFGWNASWYTNEVCLYLPSTITITGNFTLEIDVVVGTPQLMQFMLMDGSNKSFAVKYGGDATWIGYNGAGVTAPENWWGSTVSRDTLVVSKVNGATICYRKASPNHKIINYYNISVPFDRIYFTTNSKCNKATLDTNAGIYGYSIVF
ncbi:MAG: hypothetical protein ACK5MV_10580 [Aminipila sp.]